MALSSRNRPRTLADLGRSGCSALGLAACAWVSAGTLDGTATYRERAMPPPGTVFEAVLEDTARAGAPATVLGRVRIDAAGAPPYAFSIDFDDAAVTPMGRYAVRTSLVHEGRLLWRSEPSPRVFPDGVARPVAPLQVTMVHVGAPPAGGSGVSGSAAALALPPGRFEGIVPSASGPGQRWTLDLKALPAGAATRGLRYELRQQSPASTSVPASDDLGLVLPDGDRLRLVGASGEPRWLARVDEATLRLLDRDGRPVDTPLPMTLSRVPLAGMGPMVLRLSLRGEYTRVADAPTIRLCADGRRLPVAFDGSDPALERAYRAARRSPGEAVLVEVLAELGPRPSVDPSSGGWVDTVTVRSVLGAWPRETCGNPLVDSPLLSTYWKLVRLQGLPVRVAEGQREPHLVLRTGPDGVRVAGQGGCNRLMGSATVDGDGGLRLGPTAATRMACGPGADTEAAFVAALAEVVRYRIVGSHLELLGAGSEVLARLEAVALR